MKLEGDWRREKRVLLKAKAYGVSETMIRKIKNGEVHK